MDVYLKTIITSILGAIILLECLVTPVQAQNIDRDVVSCGIQQRACVCRPDADECEFTLVISELQTFTSYTIEDGDLNEQKRLPYKLESGTPYYIDGMGTLRSSRNSSEASCFTDVENFSRISCTVPQTVDGKTYRSYIGINGLVPGPTLIVNEGQQIIANVINNLLTESTSIHWHGMDMRNTPWMDGALLVSQCPIDSGESFRYYFKAEPTGTFWYHSHRITQRTDGLFGALIIRESPNRRMVLEREVGTPVFDEPASFTLNLHEWAELSAIELFTFVRGDLGYYPGKPFGDVPLPPNELAARGIPQYELYDASSGPDGTEVGDIPFWSALINGKGRHKDIPYNNTRLEVFSVSEGNSYRFRLIGGQGLYPYKFSIDEHNLTVISMDGTLVRPVETQFIIMHTGERYDFVLNARRPRVDTQDYWIRFETLEVDLDSIGPPYRSLGNIAEGILHYTSSPDQLPRSTDYENIKDNSIPYSTTTCESLSGCTAVNCPFLEFHPSYNIRCVNLRDFRLLEPTPVENLPSGELDPDCNDCEFFFNINSDRDAINGRNFHLPSVPLQTQREDIASFEFCDLDMPCDDGECAQDCVHVRNINSFNKTIRFILSSVGPDIVEGEGSGHPIHLHGHHFHVAKINYGSYNPENGLLTGPSTDIICDDPLCSKPRWNGTRPAFAIGGGTVTKDTIIVPAGGYVVIHFIADNPGYWFMHCHIEADLLEGMALVINELNGLQNPPPEGTTVCGNFNISQETYYEKLAFVPGSRGFGMASSVFLVTCLSVIAYILL